MTADPPGFISLGAALTHQAGRDPDRPALTMGERTYTRLALDREANRLARALAERGVGQDSRVAVVLPTGPRHQITCFAAWKLGATVIPLPARIADGELRHLVTEADPTLVVGVEPGRVEGVEVLPSGFEPDSSLDDRPLPDAVATTWKASTSGGSTGMPKLIWEERPALIDPDTPFELLQIQVDDVVLHPAAAYHNSSFVQTAYGLCWGAHVILMDRFDAAEWLRLVERHRVRWAYLVPTMMSRILALPDEVRAAADLSSLEIVMHMAAPCPPWVKQAWIDWIGPEPIWEIYAGTEGYGASMINGVEWLAHPGSVGKAPPRTEVRDDDGNVLPPGEDGIIFLYPPAGNPLGLTDEPRTYGDVGHIDEDGYLFLADRRTDMILSGGVNLYPAEIEGAIEQYPGIVAAAVIGLPDPDLGARAHAIIEVQSGATAPEPAELAAFLAPLLSRHKIPYTYELTAAPLRDEAGKLRRTRLRDERAATTTDGYPRLR
jgi:bile acid-coenzyme A ligase